MNYWKVGDDEKGKRFVQNIKPVMWLIVLFSGAIGLIYEVIWIRELTLIFGSTTLPVSTVLIALMSGLAVGSFYFGRLADREERPLRLYAILELGIAVFALISPLLLNVLNAMHILVYRGLNGEFYSLLFIRFALSFFFLLVPSILIGGTLPVVCKLLVERSERLGFHVGILNGLKMLGSVIGCLAVGFFLLRTLGVLQSLYLCAGINLVAAAITLGLDRQQTSGTASDRDGMHPISEHTVSQLDTTEALPSLRLTVWAFSVSGFCTFAYAVLWRRVFVSSLDPTTITTMLAVFLFGIALGSLSFARATDRIKSRSSLFGLMQIAIGLSGVAAIAAFGELHRIGGVSQSTFYGGGIGAFIGCIVVMIVPTILVGGCFPVAIRIYTRDMARLGRSIGNVCAIYIIGAIAGVLCAAFIFVPLFGIRPGIVLTAVLTAIMGCVMIFSGQTANLRSRQLLSGAATGGAILTAGLGLIVLYVADEPVFLTRPTYLTQDTGNAIISHEEGIEADVTVLKDGNGAHQLYVGTRKVADTSRWDSPSHRVIAHLPLLLHPDPKRALVIGFGMGLTAYSMTQHGVHVDAVETSKDVIDEARVHFADVNHNVLSSPSFNWTIDDERNYLLMKGEKYDIISVRSLAPLPGAWNPHIYTANFYRLCKRALTEDGILCQWLPLSLFSEANFKMALRTVIEVFPHSTLWYKYTPDFVLLIGTSERLKIDYKNFIDRTQIASISDALAHDDLDGMSLLDSFMMGEDALRSYTGDGTIFTDNRPYLGFIRAKQSVGSSRSIIAEMAKYRERVNPYLKNYGRTMAEKTEVRKQVNLYFDASQKLIEGQIGYVAGEYVEAFEYFNRGLAINPRDKVIRHHLGVAAGLVRKEEQKELKQLEQVVKETLRTNPQETEGYIQLAVIYEGQGKLDKSAKAIEKAIELKPNRLDFYLLLGPIYERQERNDEALRTYQRLEMLDSNLPAEIFAAMASIYHLKKMLPEAHEYAEKTLEANPNSWRVHYVLGNIYAEENAVRKAVDSYKRAIQLASDEPLLHSDLADLYLTQKRYDDALKSNTEALRLAPSAPELQEQRRQIQAAMQRKS